MNDEEFIDLEDIAYVTDRVVKEGSVPAYINDVMKNRITIEELVRDVIVNNDKYTFKMDEEGEVFTTDDLHEHLCELTGCDIEVIETILWFYECCMMAGDRSTMVGKCVKCGHDVLYMREGDGMYELNVECDKCKKILTFEEFNDYDPLDSIDLDERLPLQEDEEDEIIPLKNVNEVNTSYVIKAATGYRNGIWRKIQISAAATLDDLAEAVLEAFDFDHDHLYGFYMDQKLRTKRGIPVYYSPTDDYNPKSADKQMLENFGFTPKQKFLFLYDFGDEWRFAITFEKAIEEITPRAFVIQERGEAPDQYGFDGEDEDDD